MSIIIIVKVSHTEAKNVRHNRMNRKCSARYENFIVASQ